MSHAYKLINDYAEHLSGSVVEIGSLRGEGSTIRLAESCQEWNLKFYSVDFDQKAYERTKEVDGVLAYKMTGEEFLCDVFPKGERICCAYLDNFDWTYPGFERNRRYMVVMAKYAEHGFEMTNLNSQLAHLVQCVLIERLAAKRCLIILDDTWAVDKGERMLEDKTWEPDIGYDGKGGLAVPYLLTRDFKVLMARKEKYKCINADNHRVWVRSGDIVMGRNMPCTEK